MNWSNLLFGPSLTEPPLPNFFNIYAKRFRSVCRFLLRILYNDIQLYLDKNHILRLQQSHRVVVYSNHPSFWDPMLLALLTEKLWPGRAVLSAIDSAALRWHPYFHGLGFFGVQPDQPAGLRALLRTVGHLWSRPAPSCLVVTPEGHFSPRDGRPLELRRGLAAALWRHRAISVLLVPVALDYFNPIWQGTPRILVGEPFTVSDRPAGSLDELNDTLRTALQATLDRLTQPPGDTIPLLRAIP